MKSSHRLNSLVCTIALTALCASACRTSHEADGAITELEQKYSGIQEAYETGAISDVQLRSEFRMFYKTDQDMSSTLSAWVSAMPKSYAAHLSRGIYLDSRGVRARGDGRASETTAKQFAELRAYQEKAIKELDKSFSLTKKPLLSHY